MMTVQEDVYKHETYDLPWYFLSCEDLTNETSFWNSLYTLFLFLGKVDDPVFFQQEILNAPNGNFAQKHIEILGVQRKLGGEILGNQGFAVGFGSSS